MNTRADVQRAPRPVGFGSLLDVGALGSLRQNARLQRAMASREYGDDEEPFKPHVHSSMCPVPCLLKSTEDFA